ncbi:polysaccharide biosynthesis protein [Ruminococcus sp. AF18-22]|nr:polysaccharide biosynthesis protein [Ruminococcus sp. AF18-22]
MAKKHAFIRGTIVLTITGLSTRFMGFFYRIFLSHAFGEENVGLYQLIFPVYTLFISLSSAGFQTSISRTVARKMSLGRPKEAKNVLLSGLIFSCSLAFAGLLFIQANSAYIAEVFLGDPRCRLLLTASSYALPCSAVHSCICGYCYGLKQTKIPALSQLIEQTVRIASVALLYIYLQRQGTTPSVLIAVSGLVAGEFAAALYSAKSLWGRHWRLPRFAFDKAADNTKELLLLSLPLTANRLFVTLLQSIEAAAIPNCLKLYTHSASQSLRIYGVLTGMALPCILFPSALTNSVSIMLMPAVAENQAAGHDKKLSELIKKAAGSCFILGLACCLFFLLFGSFIGSFIFRSSAAGKFIVTLAWICPFLYVNGAFLSIINGLGKTTFTLIINLIGLGVRIVSVFAAVPLYGIQGYLWGLLASQFLVTLCAVLILKWNDKFN